jgi:long-chain acyl-CoA synthetase
MGSDSMPTPSRTVFTLLEEAAARWGNAPALHQPSGVSDREKYRTWSWTEYCNAACEIAAGLRRIGVRKGDVVALVSETRAEFYLADLGIMASGCISAALYTSYPVDDQIRTLQACDARAVIVEDPKAWRRLHEAANPPLAVYWILLTGTAEGALSLEELRKEGRAALESDPGLKERLRREVLPSDPAILYLTSGATGQPKMALVTHAALVFNMDMGPAVLHADPQDCMLAFLPSAHVTQRVVTELLPVRCGLPVWFSESLMRLPEELRSVRPTIFVAPPRFWERVYTNIRTQVARRPPLARNVFETFLNLGLKAARLRQERKPVPAWLRAALRLGDRLVFAGVRARFGGRMRIAGSGSAPLGKELAQFYMAIGMPLVEGYGLTEGGVVVLNPLDAPRPGSIGKALPGVELRIDSEGELLVRGPTLFAGYYNDPEATAQVLRDGWLCTGDTAEIDAEGYVYITGRKKELIVTSSGKKIFPSRIENLFRVEPIVSNVLLIGDRLPYLAALITINANAAESLEEMEEWRGRPLPEIAAAAPVVAEVSRAIRRVNRHLAQFEQIRKFRILERDFTIGDGELTATLKLRRSRALENFRDAVRELYHGKEQAH